MPLYQMAPTKLAEMYFDICDQHNREMNATKRHDLSTKAHTITRVVDLLWGNVAAGRLIMDADERLPDDGRPSCGGCYLDMDSMNASMIPLMNGLSDLAKSRA